MITAPDYFRLYGLPRSFSPDAAAVRKAYYALSLEHHPDKAGGLEGAQGAALDMSSVVNEGYRVLSSRDALMGYILELHGVLEREESYKLPPDFLMEMMELNEAVGNASATLSKGAEMSPDMLPEAKREVDAAVAQWEADAMPLMLRYDAGDHSAELLAALKDYFFRKKYLLRIKARLE